MRPLCAVCQVNVKAISYHKYGRIYYHSRCSTCQRKNKKRKKPTPRWQLAGYKKKPTCDRCGFKARHASQLLVYHVDGNLNHCELRNLKTVCLNCVQDLKRTDSTWKAGDLEPDA